jgi:hypothetical protein
MISIKHWLIPKFERKTIYGIFIAISALMSLYLWVMAIRVVFSNFLLDAQCPARVIQWEVQECGSDRFALCAHYSFHVDTAVYHGQTLFEKSTYLNPSAAMTALKLEAAMPKTAWYHRKDPARSSLEKQFPTNLLIRAIVSSLIAVYFVFLAARFNRDSSVG